jgi:hypothetical protein
MAELRKVVPEPGSYLAETSYFEPDWQKSFWGSNYPRLRQSFSSKHGRVLNHDPLNLIEADLVARCASRPAGAGRYERRATRRMGRQAMR